ncbi:MAG: helicase-related protein [Candidatus Hodarchaeales archaeon]
MTKKKLLLPGFPHEIIFKHEHEFSIPRVPAKEAELNAAGNIDEVYPYIGTLIKEQGGNCSVTETQVKLVKAQERVVVLASGTGSGKSTGVIKLAFDRALESQLKGLCWKGCVFLVPINALAQDLYSYAVELSRNYTGGSITCGLYHSGLMSSELSMIRKDPPDILFMTSDMYYRSIAGKSKSRPLGRDTVRLTPWEERLVNPSMIFFDEIDNGSGFTATCLIMMVLGIRRYFKQRNSINKIKNNTSCPFQIILGSATVPNVEEVFLPLFGDDVTFIREPAIHGEIDFTVYDSTLPEIIGEENNNDGKLKKQQFRKIKRWELFLDRLLFCEEYRDLRALVYVDNRNKIELLMKRYKNTPDIVFYHAGRWKDINRRSLRLFNSGKARVMVATSAVESGLNIENLNRVIITGLPGENRKLLQRYARVARDWYSKGHVYLFLDSQVEKEKVLLEDSGLILERLILPSPENLIINLENDLVTRFSLLFSAIIGTHSMDDLYRYHGKKRVVRTLSFLLASGTINYHGNILHRTRFTAEGLYNQDIRRIEESYSLMTVNEAGEKECIGYLNSREQIKHALPGQSLIREGTIWSVIDSSENKIWVRKRNNHDTKDSVDFIADNDVVTTVNRVKTVSSQLDGVISLVRIQLKEHVTQIKETARDKFSISKGIDLITDVPLEESWQFSREIDTEGIKFNILFHDERSAAFFGNLFFLVANREGLADNNDIAMRTTVTGGETVEDGIFFPQAEHAVLLYDRVGPSGVCRSIYSKSAELFGSTRELLRECLNQPSDVKKYLGKNRPRMEELAVRNEKLTGKEKERKVLEQMKVLYHKLERIAVNEYHEGV